jgi:hypothetical protein
MEGRDNLGVLTQLRVLWECDLVAGLLLQRVGPDTGVGGMVCTVAVGWVIRFSAVACAWRSSCSAWARIGPSACDEYANS